MNLKVAIAIAGFVLMAWPAAAEKRVALVIGNGNYRGLGILANPSIQATFQTSNR